jgi:hypothetical protein
LSNWLVITYFANLNGMAASHHIDDRLSWLQKMGIDVQLLSSICGAKLEGTSNHRVCSPLPSGLRYELRYLLRRHFKNPTTYRIFQILTLIPLIPFYALEKIFLPLESTWSWFLSAVPCGYVLSLKKRPNIIYCTGGPYAGMLAGVLLSKLTKIPCITEFQDPIYYVHQNSRGLRKWFVWKIENYIYSNSDLVIMLTENAVKAARQRNPKSRRIEVIYPGTNPIEIPANRNHRNTFRMGHFGTLADSRDMEGLLKGMELMFEENPSHACLLEIHLFGSMDNNVKAQIDSFKYPNIIINHGKISREDAFEQMGQMDLFLLIQNRDPISIETIPSKTYEYLYAAKPILGLIYRNEELKSILEHSGHYSAEADQPESIKQVLLTIYQKCKSKTPTESTNNFKFTVESACLRLIQLGQEIRKSKNND